MSDQTKQAVPQTEQVGCLAVVVRVLWLVIGNAALFFLAIRIAQRRAFSALDVAFWAVVLGLIVVRYIDITRLKGSTKDGEPASLRHWRRYVLSLLLVSGAAWALAHLVVRHWAI